MAMICEKQNLTQSQPFVFKTREKVGPNQTLVRKHYPLVEPLKQET